MANHPQLYQKMARLRQANISFALATVVETKGSSSARVGDKAVFDQAGQRLGGWVGGGCAERMVGEAASQAIVEGLIQTIHIDLNGDDILLSVACGGELTVMVEPEISSPSILINGVGRVVEVLSEMIHLIGYRGLVQIPASETDRYTHADQLITDDRDFAAIRPMPDYVVLAAHHPDDNIRAQKALELGIGYVAAIASRKRADLMREYLSKQGISDKQLQHLHTPAGLAIGAQSPEEIALSILAGIVADHNGAGGGPLVPDNR
jgi:xanthine dehydrogenase accessory factor